MHIARIACFVLKRTALRTLATSAAISVVGCDPLGDTPRDRQASVRDSAGVEIVVNPQKDYPLAISPVIKLGVVEGDPNFQFDRVRALALDSLDGFWVVDSHSSVRHYDMSGRFVGQVGAKGRGPGEADGYGAVWVTEGKVLTWGYPSVLQLFAADGTFLGSRLARSDGGGYLAPLESASVTG